MKILLSGASGYVGKKLAEYLTREYGEIHGVGKPKLNFPEHLSKYFTLSELAKQDTEYNVVIHLASLLTSKSDINTTKKILDSNTEIALLKMI